MRIIQNNQHLLQWPLALLTILTADDPRCKTRTTGWCDSCSRLFNRILLLPHREEKQTDFNFLWRSRKLLSLIMHSEFTRNDEEINCWVISEIFPVDMEGDVGEERQLLVDRWESFFYWELDKCILYRGIFTCRGEQGLSYLLSYMEVSKLGW